VISHRRDEAKQMAAGIQTLDDSRRLLDMKEIDGSSWPLPCTSMRAFSDALAAGKDLYSEKTMTWSIAERELSCCNPIAHPVDFLAAAKHCSASAMDHVIVFSNRGPCQPRSAS